MVKDIIGLVIVVIGFLCNFFGPVIYRKIYDEANPQNIIKIKIASFIAAIIGMILVFI